MKENESTYRLFFEAGVDGMLLIDNDGTIWDVNPRACDLLCRRREELVGSRLDDLSDPSYPILEAAWEELRATGSFYVSARLLRGDGSSLLASVWVVDGGKGRIGVTFREIAQREEEEAQEASAAEYRAMVESSVDGMTVVNLDNTFRYVNSAFAELMGYEPEELIGVFLPDLGHPEDLERAAALNAEIQKTSGPTRYPGIFVIGIRMAVGFTWRPVSTTW